MIDIICAVFICPVAGYAVGLLLDDAVRLWDAYQQKSGQ